MTELSREEVEQLAQECFHAYSEWHIDIERFAAAMYAKGKAIGFTAGAEDMREQLAGKFELLQSNGNKWISTVAASAVVRALTITPTNTEE